LGKLDIFSRLSLARERGVQFRNHAWTRRIVTRALAWGCGRIEIEGLPKDLADQPWKWAQFTEFLRYKGSEHGITAIL
jgi:hypothetical protein